MRPARAAVAVALVSASGLFGLARPDRNFGAADLEAAVDVGWSGDSFTENHRLPSPYALNEPLNLLPNTSGERFNAPNFGVSENGPGQPFLHREESSRKRDLDDVFHLYRDNDVGVRIGGGRIVYEKPPPCRTDPDEPFFLHVAPADANDLDDEERRAVGFDNLAFREGFWRADRNRCVGERELPNYDIAHLRTGQFDPQTGDATWETSFLKGAAAQPPDRAGDREPDGRRWIAGANPAAQPPDRVSPVALHRVGADVRIDGGRLVYEKPPPCRTDPDEPFFLHVAPADANDLDDEERRAVGFDNLAFPEGFWRAEPNRCVGERELPNYRIAHMRTGQFDPQTGDATWETSFLKAAAAQPPDRVGDREPDGRRWIAGASPAAQPPDRVSPVALHRVGADVRIDGGRLVYEKPPPCRTDPDEPFFLHVAPADANDLDDEERRAVGFDNLAFREGFWRTDRNRCVGERELPNYDIASLRTGQFDPQTGDAIWETSFPPVGGANPAEPPTGGDDPGALDLDRADFRIEDTSDLDRVGADVRIDGGRLVYEKPPPCRTDPDEPFFLHVAPADANDLDDEERRAVGFDNLAFREGFWRADRNRCVGERELPNYDVAHLRTGQFDPQTGDAIWETSFLKGGGANPVAPPPGDDDLQAEVAAQIAAVNGRIDDLRAEVAMQFAAVNARIDDLHGELRVLRALVIDAVKGTAPPD